MRKIIVLEDSQFTAQVVCSMLRKAGYSTDTTPTVDGARLLIEKAAEDDIILADYELKDHRYCTEVMAWMETLGYKQPVIVMTQYDRLDFGVDAMMHGAVHCIMKTKLDDELLPLLKSVEQTIERKTKLQNVWRRDSAQFAQLYKNATIIAKTSLSVMIHGESGTGKEHIARMIHDRSSCANKPMVCVDCSSFTDDLAESAFFGHIKGAFTGATEDRKGYLGQANGSTLYLDEVGNLSTRVQQMLLRALQEKKYRPIGSTVEQKFDIRLVCATNKDLNAAMREGSFLMDFYFRIKEYQLEIPPLRECREDIMPLAKFLLERANASCHTNVKGFDDSAQQVLMEHWWPGNVRELALVIKSAVPFCQQELMTAKDIEIDHTITREMLGVMTLEEFRNNVERSYIIKILKRVGGNTAEAYKILGLPKSSFYDKLKKLDIPTKLYK